MAQGNPRRQSFGELLRAAIEQRGVSREDLGIAAGYGKGVARDDAKKRVREFETGKFPRREHYQEICRILNLSFEEKRRLHWAYVVVTNLLRHGID